MSGPAIDRFIELMNRYGADKEPFLFIIDFEMKCPEIHKLSSVPRGIKFSTPLVSNISLGQICSKLVALKKYPVSYDRYSAAFQNVQKNIKLGNS